MLLKRKMIQRGRGGGGGGREEGVGQLEGEEEGLAN